MKMSNAGMSLGLAALAVLFAGPLRAAAPWTGPYEAGSDLWHLDEATAGASPNAIPKGPALRCIGRAEMDAAEKRFGAGSLHFSGGSAVANGVRFEGNPRSFEFFLKVHALPEEGKNACIFSMISDTPRGGDNLLSLELDRKGELTLRYVYEDGRLDGKPQNGCMRFPQKRIETGRWTHISIHFLLNEYNMVRFVMDGEILDEGQMYTAPWTVRLVVGNSAGGDQPFDGWMDEIRIADCDCTRKAAEPGAFPQPDPDAKRPPFGDPKFFPSDDLLFYLPLDGTLEPAVFQGKRQDAQPFKWTPKEVPPRYGPGLRGKALGIGGQVLYPSEGNLLPESGTLSCWFWYSGDIRNLGTIFKLGGMYIKGDHGLLYGATSRTRLGSASDWPGRPLEAPGVHGNLAAGEWNHVALAWKGEWIDAYLNGCQVDTFLVPGGIQSVMGPWFGVGEEWYKYGEDIGKYGLVDEMMIFRRALSPREIENIYRHALAKEPLQVEARHTRMDTCLGQGKLILTVDQEIAGIIPGEDLVARLLDVNGNAVSETRTPRMLAGAAELVLDTANLPKGEYTVEVIQKRKDGSVAFTDACNYKHDEFPWLKEHVGEEDRVLAPWTPLESRNGAIRVSGREIHLDGLALPKDISVKGHALLAAPAFFELVGDDGRVQRLTGGDGSPQLESASPTRAVYTGSLHHGLFAMAIRNDTEYDGCSRIALRLSPGTAPGKIGRLTLVLPLSAEFARYINAKDFAFCSSYLIGALPRAKGRVFGSYLMPMANASSVLATEADTLKLLAHYQEWNALRSANKPIPKEFAGFKIGAGRMSSGSFIPYLWVGNPEGGLCWFADTDRGWVRSDGLDTPALEVRRTEENGVAELRVNLIAEPVRLETSREIVFGMIPTPVRPLLPDWRKRCWQSPIITGFGKEWESGRFFKRRGCFGAYQGEPYPMDWDRARWYTDTYGRTGDSQVPYFEFSNIHIANFPPHMESEWRVQPGAWREQGGIFQTRSYADWWCYHFLRYRKVAAPDGVYFDNVFLRPSLNEYSHGAWRDEKGELQASYNLWGLRAMLKRVRTVFQDTGIENPWIQMHMTHYNLINAMGFGEILFDGEDMVMFPKQNARSFLDCWPLDTLTAIDSPHAWGVPTRFLQHIRGSAAEWDKVYEPGYQIAMRAGIGSLLLVDCYSDALDEDMHGMRADLVRWGVLEEDCGFIGHWRDFFQTGDPDVKVSAYQRPESLLLIVQNRNGGVSKSVQIRFNPQGVLSYGVDAAKAGDVETQRRKENGAVVIRPLHPDFTCALRAEGGNWVLDAGSISPRDFRMVSIARKHVPQGGDPHE